MTRTARIAAPILLALTSATLTQASDSSLSARILGAWICDSGVCWDEEVAFSEVDGVRSFDSWLHARPSASGGTWTLDGDRLAIRCCAGIEYDYIIISATERELVLHDAETGEETRLTRVGSEPVTPEE